MSAGACPCGLGLPYAECCGRAHQRFAATGKLTAPTAEALMRSRFAAFARLGEADPNHDDGAAESAAMVAYLRATWAAEHRPSAADLTPTPAEPAARFTRLAVLSTQDGGPFQDRGVVEFVAVGEGEGGRFRLHETSRFRREGGAWVYVDGEVR